MNNRYPPYPDSNWDAAVKETARIKLKHPNKTICLYCHGQAVVDTDIKHLLDCPYLLDQQSKKKK